MKRKEKKRKENKQTNMAFSECAFRHSKHNIKMHPKVLTRHTSRLYYRDFFLSP